MRNRSGNTPRPPRRERKPPTIGRPLQARGGRTLPGGPRSGGPRSAGTGVGPREKRFPGGNEGPAPPRQRGGSIPLRSVPSGGPFLPERRRYAGGHEPPGRKRSLSALLPPEDLLDQDLRVVHSGDFHDGGYGPPAGAGP